MKRLLTIGSLLFLIPVLVFGTHNRAGQITFELISGYTYRITVTTFTYTKSAADREQVLVDWGDNSTSLVDRTLKVQLPNDYFHNKYTTNHTFPGPGIYEIVMQDPNRNYGINNIPNSVNVIFSIKSTLVISPEIGRNSSPQLLNFPIDKAALGHIFIHNPSAFDPDGDSLSYKISICTEQDGKPIENYQFPSASDTLYVDPAIGDFIWYTPVDTGKYNVAMNIEEWRYGVKIGNITRDMQINVYETDNNPPVNQIINPICVEAGALIEFQITSTDADNDSVKQTMTGGPLVILSSPATFTEVARGLGTSLSTFRWQTNCNHIRNQPWQLTLKSQDRNADIQLIDIDNILIRVVAPAPKNLISTANSNDIALSWDQSKCGAVAGYYVYRREGSYDFSPDSCEVGVPAYTGFVKIGSLGNREDTTFIDDNNGEGLVQGIDYCYMVTAFYEDGSESFASEESCNSLVPGFPALLNVSVTQIDEVNGSIFVSWAKPRNFDNLSAPGPYVFQISRSITENADDFVIIDSILTSDLNDTTFSDNPVNTIYFPYYYTVRMFNNTPGNRFEMRAGENEVASSLFIQIIPGDNKLLLNIRKKAPWINENYVIYRRTAETLFDSIAYTDNYFFEDTGLKNGQTYFYQVKSNGWRPLEGSVFINSNFSHMNFAAATDNTPSCAPELFVESLCDSNAMNILTWTNPNNTCSDDVVRYKVYYSSNMSGTMDSLASIPSVEDTVFYHRFEEGQLMAGCYSVSAIDSFGNESPLSTSYCVDQCSLYELPNVFSPNGRDNINDVFEPINKYHGIEKVDMKIFNRYGQLVFETNNPDIEWRGTYRTTDTRLSSGVYYYICDVYEPRISGTEIRTLVGFVHLYADGDAETITK